MPTRQLGRRGLYIAHRFSRDSIYCTHNGSQQSRGEQAGGFDRALHRYVNLSDHSGVTALLVRVRLANT